MKWRLPGLTPFAVFALSLFAMPLHAQTTQARTQSAAPPKYDITREVTLVATVGSVVTKATPEMNLLGGSHLMLVTTAGNIDACLGVFPVTGQGALRVSPSERVQVTGVMKVIRQQQVFVTRLVVAGSQVYRIRNEHGFVLLPALRKGNANSEMKGAKL
jgi:hypothetical protein